MVCSQPPVCDPVTTLARCGPSLIDCDADCGPSTPSRYAEPEWQIEQDVIDGKLYGSMWGLKKSKRPHGEEGADGQEADSLLARRAAEARARVERAGSMIQGGRSFIRSEGEAVL